MCFLICLEDAEVMMKQPAGCVPRTKSIPLYPPLEASTHKPAAMIHVA
jgi:hypothetical protein